MNEFKIFISKLLKLNVVKVEEKVIHTLEGFTISYRLEMNQSSSMLPSVQVVLDVRYQGQKIEHWGCMGEEDQKQVVDFILKSNYIASQINDTQSKVLKKEGIDLFKNL